MSLQLLLETHEAVTSLKSIESANVFGGQRSTIVILPHSVVLINADTGMTLHTFDFPKKKASVVVDCVYVEESRCFLVAFSGSTLAVVGEKGSSGDVMYVQWPQQPSKLLAVKNKGVIIVCTDSTVWHIALEGGLVPVPTFIETSLQDYKNIVCLGASSSGDSVSVVRQKKPSPKEKKGKKGDKAAESSDEIECSIITWNIPHIESGGNRVFLESSAVVSDFSVGKGEAMVNICSHSTSRSLSVLFAEGSSFRWMKFDNYDGSLLFERKVGGKEGEKGQLLNAIACGSLLWLVREGGATLWDPRYGVQLASLPVNTPTAVVSVNDSSSNRYSGLSTIYAPEVSSSAQLAGYHLTVCVPHKDGASVFQTILKIPATQISGSLCNSLGRLIDAAETESEAATGKEKKSRKTKISKVVEEVSILSQLPEEVRKVLVDAKSRIAAEREGSHNSTSRWRAGKEEGVEKEGREGREGDRVLRRRKPFYVDIPPHAAHMFLDLLNGLSAAPHPEDWETVETLLVSGTVSASKNGQNGRLVQQVLDAQRYDILSVMARYLPDLSERSAVRYLFLAATASDEALGHLYTDAHGYLRYRAESLGDEKKRAPKSAKKAKKGAEEREGAKEGKEEKRMTHGQLLTAMMENIIRRTSSYSTILLSDALKTLITPSFSVILLRVVILFLKGLCAPLWTQGEGGEGLSSLVRIFTSVSSCTGTPNSGYSDEHVHRAITWAEAVLDSHFSALAFRASFHAPTRQVLGSVMETVATADEAAQEVEKVLGMWTHVCRVAEAGGDHQTPSTSLYQQDKLRF